MEHTMVIFGNFLSKNYSILGQKWLKMTMVDSLKLVNFSRTLAFYLRGYSRWNYKVVKPVTNTSDTPKFVYFFTVWKFKLFCKNMKDHC